MFSALVMFYCVHKTHLKSGSHHRQEQGEGKPKRKHEQLLDMFFKDSFYMHSIGGWMQLYVFLTNQKKPVDNGPVLVALLYARWDCIYRSVEQSLSHLNFDPCQVSPRICIWQLITYYLLVFGVKADLQQHRAHGRCISSGPVEVTHSSCTSAHFQAKTHRQVSLWWHKCDLFIILCKKKGCVKHNWWKPTSSLPPGIWLCNDEAHFASSLWEVL